MVISQKVYFKNIRKLFQCFDTLVLLIYFFTLILDVIIIAKPSQSSYISNTKTFFYPCFRKLGKS